MSMINSDPGANTEFWQRYEKAIKTELFIGGLQIRVASTLTNDALDNYPVLVFFIQRPSNYPPGMPDEFFILPLSPRTVSRDNQPIMPELVVNTIIKTAGDLFNTIYGGWDSKEESTEGLTFPDR